MIEKTIHLVFKTHLDIGFTDHAARVRQQYHEQFIPQAIATGAHFHAENPECPEFIWTTGAWLIWDHLNSQPPERVRMLEQAIARGLVTWHGLPFTTHSELMSPALFRAGLGFAQELDKRFGRTTIAAKMTDVPGHALGVVPLLAEAGIRFLHLGVNTASPVPDVPPIFCWRAPAGEEVVVMYQGSYGATDFPAGDDIGLSFAHTNDNIGPQSVGQVVEVLRHLRHEHDRASVAASTLDAFGAAMWARRENFPVLTSDIGDSWIHGAASDPVKLARFRTLQRVYDGFETLNEGRRAFGRDLTMVAEHTWGVDIKTYLRDEKAWDRADFDAARRRDYRFAYAERSWAEQRAYLAEAVTQLSPDDQAEAKARLAELAVPPMPEVSPTRLALEDAGWLAELDQGTGDILRLVAPDGQALDGGETSLMAYRHESYDWHELQKHLDSYLQHRDEWAILDHDKPGLAKALSARTAAFSPAFLGASTATGLAEMPAAAHAALGAPTQVGFRLRGINERRVEITLILYGKPANRMPEAGFVSLTPLASSPWQFKKLGVWRGAGDIVRRGGGQLQSVEAARTAGLTVQPLDSALVSPAGAPFMPFQPEVPDFSAGLRFNLYNNKWGTNFPMWWEGDAAFRFLLDLAPSR